MIPMSQVDGSTPDWSTLIRAGDHVACSQMSAEPVALLRSLAASNVHAGRFHVFLGVPFTNAAAEFPPSTTFTTFGGMGSAAALARSRAVRVSMRQYSQVASAFDDGDEPVDVALVSLARSADGHLHLGAAHGYALAAARRARCVVAEVNALAPVVGGARWPADIALAAVVDVSYPIAEPPGSTISDVERRIAGNVAPLVADGACIQVGIGTLASALLDGLRHHRSLGLHSGMLTPAVWRLMQCGALDNARKSIDTGIAVTGCVYGDAALYRAVHENRRIALREPGYTHAREVIARLVGFTAINSALEVDLLGQMNAETVTGEHGARRQVGGVGGLNDFMRAARHAPRGLAVVALPSRRAGRSAAPGGSRIVGTLSGPSTVAACDADVVVTEYGVARLRHASLDERAQRLIGIAHPDDRDALRDVARRTGQLP